MIECGVNTDAIELGDIPWHGDFELWEEERRAWQPPPDLKVDEWADSHRILQSGTSRQPGPWSTETTPYLREPMRTYNDTDIRHMVLCFGTQLGKTETLYNILGYIIDLEPYSTLLVYPREPDAKTISRSRLQPMIAECPSLVKKVPEKGELYQTLEMYFPGMVLYLVGANSAAGLSQKACRNILRDEVDKYPERVGKDADPLSLSEERAKSFWDIRKVIDVSSPTLEDFGIWKQLQGCEQVMKYHVPCPSCGRYQELLFKWVKWETGEAEEINEKVNRARNNARYECKYCNKKIGDEHKMAILKEGKWKAERKASGKIESIGYHLSSLYSPWLTWGEVAEVFLKAEHERGESGDQDKLQNFVNGWLAEPWKVVVEKPKEAELLKKRCELEAEVVPKEAVALTVGIDVQMHGFYYTVWAWSRTLRSWLIQYGYMSTWEEITDLCFNTQYDVEQSGGRTMGIWRGAIDTAGAGEGWSRTVEIYEWLRDNGRGMIWGIKGMSREGQGTVVRASVLDKFPGKKGKIIMGGLTLFHLDTSALKETLFWRLGNGEEDPQPVYFHKGTRKDFVRHLLAEEKRRNKQGKYEWVQIRHENHYLDCSVYASACVDAQWAGGIRLMTGMGKHKAGSGKEKKGKGGWLAGGKKWLKKR